MKLAKIQVHAHVLTCIQYRYIYIFKKGLHANTQINFQCFIKKNGNGNTRNFQLRQKRKIMYVTIVPTITFQNYQRSPHVKLSKFFLWPFSQSQVTKVSWQSSAYLENLVHIRNLLFQNWWRRHITIIGCYPLKILKNAQKQYQYNQELRLRQELLILLSIEHENSSTHHRAYKLQYSNIQCVKSGQGEMVRHGDTSLTATQEVAIVHIK